MANPAAAAEMDCFDEKKKNPRISLCPKNFPRSFFFFFFLVHPAIPLAMADDKPAVEVVPVSSAIKILLVLLVLLVLRRGFLVFWSLEI